MKKSMLQRSSLQLIRRQNQATITTATATASSNSNLPSLSQHHVGSQEIASYSSRPNHQPCVTHRFASSLVCSINTSHLRYSSETSQRKIFGTRTHTSRYFSTLSDSADEQKPGPGHEHDDNSSLKDIIETDDFGNLSNESMPDIDIESNSLLSLLSDELDIDIDILSDDDSSSSTSSSSNSTSNNAVETYSKPKKKKKKRMKQPPKANLIPKVPTQQSKVNAQLLFDYIAPHVDEKTLQMLLTKMKEFESLMEQELSKKKSKSKSNKRKGKSTRTQKEIMEYQTLIGRVDAFFSMEKKKKVRGRKMKNAKYLKKHPWIKSLIAQFFAGATGDSNSVTNAKLDSDANLDDGESSKPNENTPIPLSMDLLWRDPTFTPNINRKKRKEAVSTLMLAREMSLESPLLWSRNQRRKKKKMKDDVKQERLRREGHYEKSAQQLKEEAEAIASVLSFRIHEAAHDEVLDLFRGYAENVSQTVADRSDGNDSTVGFDTGGHNHDEVHSSNDDSDNDEDIEDDDQSKAHVEIMKMLFTNLKRRVGFHVHFIATELAEFFYVELPEQMQGEGSSIDLYEMPLEPMGKSDARINESWENWNSLRDDLVDTFLSSQHMYVRLQSAIKKGDSDQKEKKSKTKAVEVEEEEVEKIMVKYSNDAHERTAEELVEELDRLRTNADGEMVGRSPATMQRPGRAPKGANLQFECLMLHDKFGPYSNADTAFLADLEGRHHSMFGEISPDIVDHLPDTNRSIFVDNLPIDITREELEYLYSRCGSVESIEVFNLRPDLDPGELTKNAMRRRRKRNRMSGKKGATQIRNERSPVYAVIKFEDIDGYNSAAIDMLRIFGMVIRRQAVKSHPARNMHKLFIEDIPEGLIAMDLEEKLSKALHPDMYISLKLSQHANAQPKSCEITFPTFEVSHHAYHQLKQLDFGDQKLNLHWMKTPANAVAYWTREQLPNI